MPRYHCVEIQQKFLTWKIKIFEKQVFLDFVKLAFQFVEINSSVKHYLKEEPQNYKVVAWYLVEAAS